MTTLKVNENNDLYIEQGTRMVVLDGIEAASSSSLHRAKSQKGEMVYQTQLGVNYQGTVFGDVVNLQEFRDSLIENIKRTPDVEDVPQCTVDQVVSTVEYSATIQTIFGPETING